MDVDPELGAELERLIGSTWWQLRQIVPNDLSRTGASVLKTLVQEGPQRVTTLAAKEPVAQPTMTAIIQRLERRGLVSRSQDPLDRRATLVEITAAGEQVMRARVEARAFWLASRLSGLTADERQTVLSALTLLTERLGDQPDHM